jgi:hypothetical protein
VGDRLLLKEPVAHLLALDVGRCVQALGATAATVGQRHADLVGVRG